MLTFDNTTKQNILEGEGKLKSYLKLVEHVGF